MFCKALMATIRWQAAAATILINGGPGNDTYDFTGDGLGIDHVLR